MQVAIGCILRECWVPASQDRTYPVPLWAYSLCLVWLPLEPYSRTLTCCPLGAALGDVGGCTVGMTQLVQPCCSLRLAVLCRSVYSYVILQKLLKSGEDSHY